MCSTHILLHSFLAGEGAVDTGGPRREFFHKNAEIQSISHVLMTLAEVSFPVTHLVIRYMQ